MQTDIQTAVNTVLESARAANTDFTDIFVEMSAQDEFRFENQQIDQFKSGTEIGVGIRIIKGGHILYSIAHSLDPEILHALVVDTMLGLKGESKHVIPGWQNGRRSELAGVEQPPGVDYRFIFEQLITIDRHARKASQSVQQVTIQFLSQRRHVTIGNSKGVYQSELRRFSRTHVQAIAVRGRTVQTGVNTVALTVDEKELFSHHPASALGIQAGTMAETMLNAIPAPTGVLPVVVGNGRGGVLIHEACVHCIEGDYIAQENSVYRGRLGHTVAQPFVSIIDDGTLLGQTGSSRMDDEGTPTRGNVLVENGCLQSYLTDLAYARKLKHHVTGSGRRQSYAFLPMPRMTNTFIPPREELPEEIIAETQYGVYARRVSGGQVNPVTGEFVFTVTEGYLIEEGRITRPLIPFTLTGNGPDVLLGIDRVAHDFAMAAVMCGKNGQIVPVSVGQPTIRVQNLVVGGTRK